MFDINLRCSKCDDQMTFQAIPEIKEYQNLSIAVKVKLLPCHTCISKLAGERAKFLLNQIAKKAIEDSTSKDVNEKGE